MTPRELALQADGYRWRDERVMEKCAWLAAHLLQPWAKPGQTIQPADLLKPPSEGDFEQLAGLDDPNATIDAMLAKQAARRKVGLPST